MSIDFMGADLREVIDALYWVSDRSSDARTDWNTDIFEWVSRIDEDDYE
jgi:hypothetical protein